MKQSIKIESLYIFALLMVSSVVYAFYVYLATQNHFSQLEPMIYGTASKPYVYRVLAPIIIRILAGVTNTSPFLMTILIMYLSLIGFSMSMSALVRTFIPSQYFRIWGILAPIGLVPFLFEQRHIYDFPTLFLFTLALYYLAKNDFPKYLLVFVFATLSKETSLFLVIFFIMQFSKIERKRFLPIVFIQIIIYLLIRLSLIMLFRNNLGELLEFHLYEHVSAYIHNPISSIVLFCAIVVIISISIFALDNKANFVRNSLIAIGCPTLCLYFFFGVPFEIRIFLETYPSIYLTICLAVIFFYNRFANVKRIKIAG